MDQKQFFLDFSEPAAPIEQGVAVARDEFNRMEAAALRNRAQTLATLSTIAGIVPLNSSPPFSMIDPHTVGLMAIGHAIDALRLLDIETSDMTVRDLEAFVAK